MPGEPKPVDREAVRVLAINIGVREAARRLGLNEDTVCSWAKRGNWFALQAPAQALSKSREIIASNLQAKPGDVMLSTLNEHKNETRLSLARSVRKLAKDAEKANLKQSKHVLNVAQTAGHTFEDWQPKQTQGVNVMVNLALLGVEPGQIGVIE